MDANKIEIDKDNVLYISKNKSNAFGNYSLEVCFYLCREYLRFFNSRVLYKNELSKLNEDRSVSRTLFQFENEKTRLENNIEATYCAEIEIMNLIWECRFEFDINMNNMERSTIFDPSSAMVENMLRKFMKKHKNAIETVLIELDLMLSQHKSWYFVTRTDDHKKDLPSIIELSKSELYKKYRAFLREIHHENLGINLKTNERSKAKFNESLFDVFIEFFKMPIHEEEFANEMVSDFVNSIFKIPNSKPQNNLIVSYLLLEPQRKYFLYYLRFLSGYHTKYMMDITKHIFMSYLCELLHQPNLGKGWSLSNIRKFYVGDGTYKRLFRQLTDEQKQDLKECEKTLRFPVNKNFLKLILDEIKFES